MDFLLGTLVCGFLWELSLNVFEQPLIRSTVHSFGSVALSYLQPVLNYPIIINGVFSSGYFLSDLNYVTATQYTIHHIFGIVELWLLTRPPYTYYNMMPKVMIIELSTPFLNLYLYTKKNPELKKYSKNTLILYLLMHIFYRNYVLTTIYIHYLPKLIEKGLPYNQVIGCILFIIGNYYWTLTTYKALSKIGD